MSSESYRHHYIPKFYLKRWTGPDGKLVVFLRQHHGIAARLKTPSQTGWEPRLYSTSLQTKGTPDQLERGFMAPLDDVAAEVADIMVTRAGGSVELDRRHRDGWTRFLMSLMHRSPARVAAIKAQFADVFDQTPVVVTSEHRVEYERLRQRDWPASVEDYLESKRTESVEQGGLIMIARLADSEMLGTHLNGMVQQVIRLTGKTKLLLTSDQPLVVSGGLGDPNTFLMLALSPHHLFLSTNTETRMGTILAQVASGRVVLENNASVVRNAERFAYGSSEAEFAFVKTHFQ